MQTKPYATTVKRPVKKAWGRAIHNTGYLFITPFVLIFLLFSIYPVFRTLYISFTSYKGFGKIEPVGIDNYTRVFGDPIYWDAFVNTLQIWSVNIILQLGIALALTVVFNDMKYRINGLGVFRALFYLPNLIAATSVAFLFKNLLDWKFGSFNQILLGSGLMKQAVNWLGMPMTAQVSVSVIGAWMWFGNSFILLMAAVQGISRDYYESAIIDGAGRWKIFSKITMPLIKPVMLYVAITSLIGGLQMFDIPFLITDGQGAPSRSLNTAVMYLYNMAFRNRQMGYAAAIAFVLFAIIAIASAVTYKLFYRRKED